MASGLGLPEFVSASPSRQRLGFRTRAACGTSL